MINNFYSWIDSKYDNIEQSQMYPTFYSNITITNCVLDTGFIYGEQTNKSKNIVYRQYLIKPIQQNDQIILQSYNFERELHLGFKQLSNLICGSHKRGCDINFNYKNNKFYGSICGEECILNFKGVDTYIKTLVRLSENEYHIYDKGFCIKTDKQIWGSNHKHYRFKKIDKGYLWNGG